MKLRRVNTNYGYLLVYEHKTDLRKGEINMEQNILLNEFEEYLYEEYKENHTNEEALQMVIEGRKNK